MTSKATPLQAPPEQPDDNDLIHYTPEQAVEKFNLPTTPGEIRKLAYKRKIAHSKLGGRISLTAPQIRALSEQFAVEPFTKPPRA